MSDQQAGFRDQQRFSDPAEAVPAEWTAPTPVNGLPLGYASRPLVSQPDDPTPYFDLSTVALLGQPNRAPSEGWRKWLYRLLAMTVVPAVLLLLGELLLYLGGYGHSPHFFLARAVDGQEMIVEKGWIIALGREGLAGIFEQRIDFDPRLIMVVQVIQIV